MDKDKEQQFLSHMKKEVDAYVKKVWDVVNRQHDDCVMMVDDGKVEIIGLRELLRRSENG